MYEVLGIGSGGFVVCQRVGEYSLVWAASACHGDPMFLVAAARCHGGKREAAQDSLRMPQLDHLMALLRLEDAVPM